ncbi:uncharacterized protein SRS1_14693 [Sporisorium reilianum f. sp. reilianum]|uniref:Uncharacterized protein n=1 Tax=Sporisorium reilianum f. sp. reilianum TaxID=72559 RepID=A0A2N8UGZ5_9BASI|nr:uncharacterized protein SRS1_14693 [Sporisorium reilianum f. sp. reilianum]
MDGLPPPQPPPPSAGIAPPTPTPITSVPQMQQAFSSLAQMYEALAGPLSAEQRLLRMEASVQNINNELTRLQSSLTTTQDIVSSTQRDLAACRGHIRELQSAVNQHAQHINSHDSFASVVKQENAKIMQHLNGVSHGIAQFEARVANAHVQLNERVTHDIGQQAAKMDNFQNRIVAPLFSAIQQVLVGNSSSSRLPSPHRIEPAPEEDKAQTPEQQAEEGNTDTVAVASDHEPAASAAADAAAAPSKVPAVEMTRSDSQDSNAPLADAHVVRSRDTPAPPSFRDRAESDSGARNVQVPAAQAHQPNAPLPNEAAHPASLASPSPAARPSSEHPAAALAFIPRREARVPSAPVRILPRPSPTSPDSTSTQDAVARSTPGTSRASSLSFPVQTPMDPSSSASANAAMPTNESPPMKRKRTPSVEFVRETVATTLANKVRRKDAGQLAAARPVDGQHGHEATATRRAPKPSLTPAPFPVGSPRPFGHVAPQSAGASAANHAATGSPAIGTLHTEHGASVPPTPSLPLQTQVRQVTAERATPQSGSDQLPSNRPSAPSVLSPVELRQVPQINVPASLAPFHGSPVPLSRPVEASSAQVAPSAHSMGATEPVGQPQVLQNQPLQPSNVPNVAPAPSDKAAAPPAKPAIAIPTTHVQAVATPAPSAAAPLATPREPVVVTQPPQRPIRVKSEPEPTETGRSAEPSSQPVASVDTASTSISQVNSDRNARQNVGNTGEPVVAVNEQLGTSAQPVAARHEQHAASRMTERHQSLRTEDVTMTEQATDPRSRGAAPSMDAARSNVSRETTMSIPEPSRSDPTQHASGRMVASLPDKPLPESRRASLPERPGQLESAPSTADRGITQTRLQWLESLQVQPSDVKDDRLFYIWAWLGRAQDWTGNPNETTPVVIAPNRAITDSLVAESLAEDLIQRGYARTIIQGTTAWLELDLSWRFNTGRQHVRPGGTNRFHATQCQFIIVPRRYMRDGITLGQRELSRLKLVLVSKSVKRAYVGVRGRIETGIHANLFPKTDRDVFPGRPFHRLCKLAEIASSRRGDPRFRAQRPDEDRRHARDQAHTWQPDACARRVRAPRTPPLADRLTGTIDELSNTYPPAREASQESTGTSWHPPDEDAGWPHRRVSRTDTSSPSCALSQQADTAAAHGTRAQHASASGAVAVFDSGSPLSELCASDDEGQDELDELVDE